MMSLIDRQRVYRACQGGANRTHDGHGQLGEPIRTPQRGLVGRGAGDKDEDCA